MVFTLVYLRRTQLLIGLFLYQFDYFRYRQAQCNQILSGWPHQFFVIDLHARNWFYWLFRADLRDWPGSFCCKIGRETISTPTKYSCRDLRHWRWRDRRCRCVEIFRVLSAGMCKGNESLGRKWGSHGSWDKIMGIVTALSLKTSKINWCGSRKGNAFNGRDDMIKIYKENFGQSSGNRGWAKAFNLLLQKSLDLMSSKLLLYSFRKYMIAAILVKETNCLSFPDPFRNICFKGEIWQLQAGRGSRSPGVHCYMFCGGKGNQAT